jgi:acetyl-CoA synthetase
VRTRLSAHAYPHDIEFIQEMPMTTIGKVRRRDLRELERQRKSGGSA